MIAWDPIVRWVAPTFAQGLTSWLVWVSWAKRKSAEIAGRFGGLRARLLPRPGLMLCRQTLSLTPQHTVHLVEFAGRQFLLACHPTGVTPLSGDISRGVEEGEHGKPGAAA